MTGHPRLVEEALPGVRGGLQSGGHSQPPAKVERNSLDQLAITAGLAVEDEVAKCFRPEGAPLEATEAKDSAAAKGKDAKAVANLPTLSLWARTNRLFGAAGKRAVGVLGAAKVTVYAKVAGTMSFAQCSAAAAVEHVGSHLTGALRTTHDATALAFGHAAAVQGILLVVYKDLRNKGMMTWAVDGASEVATRTCSATKALASSAADKCDNAKKRAVGRATEAAALAQTKASELTAGACAIATDKKFQVSAASAASGAVALGVGGGATGLAAGSALGAAVGMVPALFTFGLSVPLGAAIGGGAGLVAGTAVGGAVGAIGAGAAGYGAYSKKEDLGRCADYVKAKAAETTGLVKDTSAAALGRVVEKASAAGSRLVGRSGTGGTEAAD
eukprot:CAMPEP_0179062020 /NCGR_PEP_ID=MMETSP0796-20121207/26716_1 /TAXON_ID=73915 /ORGANISM="Pyrodinium bahamense, Strain pbaha01" /LENGTH=386 /DNA_ID=CAMNT_0020758921 /DNA_START=70 /DNA_END=1230 /DNA_ORIENTATION=+